MCNAKMRMEEKGGSGGWGEAMQARSYIGTWGQLPSPNGCFAPTNVTLAISSTH